jgi:hypothetical protein
MKGGVKDDIERRKRNRDRKVIEIGREEKDEETNRASRKGKEI